MFSFLILYIYFIYCFAYIAQLRVQCDQFDLLTDELFVHDVCNVADDLRYFVFEDEMKVAVLCFSRYLFIICLIVYNLFTSCILYAEMKM